MILEEAPESTKQLCTLKLQISYVSRKGGTRDFEKEPMLVAFIIVAISTLCIHCASLSGLNLLVVVIVYV